MDATFVQVSQRAAALLLVQAQCMQWHKPQERSGIHRPVMGRALSPWPVIGRALSPWPVPLCQQAELQGTVRCCILCSLVCSSAGAPKNKVAPAWVTGWLKTRGSGVGGWGWGGGGRSRLYGPHQEAALVQESLHHCCCSGAQSCCHASRDTVS